MKLADLLAQLEYTCLQGTLDREVTQVIYDSEKAVKGCLFICIQGADHDGHDFAKDAVERGAEVLIVSRELPDVTGSAVTGDAADSDAAEGRRTENAAAAGGVTVIRVADTRYAMAFISAAWFGHPAEKLKVIGITGTKGKTTTAYLVRSILERGGYRVGLIGTVEVIIGKTRIKAGNTTPESWLLQEYLHRMVQAGLDAVVMEVSSQALMLHRTQGFVFDYGVFTNLEPDHIGPKEHACFEEYLACKGLLFRQCRTGIVNGDDSHWRRVTEGHTCRLETFGFGEDCMIRAENPKLVRRPGNLGVTFRVSGPTQMDAEVGTPGKFSVYNALAAIAVCRHFDVGESKMKEALLTARVKGRIEPVKISDKFTLLIDYAHNAMALNNLLTTLRAYEPHRLICVFGCGGNRSVQRRFEMGEVSGRLADLTVITSDNPRFEEPMAIIEDIKSGIKKTEGRYLAICDRKEAIGYAISHAEEGDIIVLAGKGHEDYQEIRGVKYPMDERVLIRELLEEGTEHI